MCEERLYRLVGFSRLAGRCGFLSIGRSPRSNGTFDTFHGEVIRKNISMLQNLSFAVVTHDPEHFADCWHELSPVRGSGGVKGSSVDTACYF